MNKPSEGDSEQKVNPSSEGDPNKVVKDPDKRNISRKVLAGAVIIAVVIGIGNVIFYTHFASEETPTHQQNPGNPSIAADPTPKPTATPKPTPVPILGYTINEPGDASLEDITAYAHTVLFITANYEPDTKEYEDAMNLYNLMVWDVVNSDSVEEVHDKYVEVVRIFYECVHGPMSRQGLNDLNKRAWSTAEDYYESRDKEGKADSWRYNSLDEVLGTQCKTT